MKKISIITCGPGIDEVKSLYGQASDWIQTKLSKYDIKIKVVKGYEKELLDIDDDAWIITGSAHSVYENLDWISYIKSNLLNMLSANKPVLGICFGHQLIADTFGGKVELNKNGWELGSCTIDLKKESANCPLYKNMKNPLDVYQSHQDIVTEIPKESVLLAQNEMGVQSFVYKDIFYGVQFHPEFTFEVMQKYLAIRYRKGIIDAIPNVKELLNPSLILNNFIENIV